MNNTNRISELFSDAQAAREKGQYVIVVQKGDKTLAWASFDTSDEAFEELHKVQPEGSESGHSFKMLIPAHDGMPPIDIDADQPQLALDTLLPQAGDLTAAAHVELAHLATARDEAMLALHEAALKFAHLQAKCNVKAAELRAALLAEHTTGAPNPSTVN